MYQIKSVGQYNVLNSQFRRPMLLEMAGEQPIRVCGTCVAATSEGPRCAFHITWPPLCQAPLALISSTQIEKCLWALQSLAPRSLWLSAEGELRRKSYFNFVDDRQRMSCVALVSAVKSYLANCVFSSVANFGNSRKPPGRGVNEQNQK